MELGPLWISNPLGLLGLLGLPAVLLIHLLQARPRPVRTSTLFLWDPGRRPAAEGRAISPLVASAQLILRLLAVCLFTWLLSAPRVKDSGGTLPVVLLLDSSASMQAFRPETEEALQALLTRLDGTPLSLRLIEVGGSGRTIYAGEDPRALLAALPSWRPYGGPGDPARALQLAAQAAGPEALYLWITDHPKPLEGARVLGLGRVVRNLGFAGMSAKPAVGGRWAWQATVENYGDQPAQRRLSIAQAGQPDQQEELSLQPGERHTIRGEADAALAGLTLRLSPGDAFSVDDQLPIAQPKPKPLSVQGKLQSPLSEWLPALSVRRGGGADVLVAPAKRGRWAQPLSASLGAPGAPKGPPMRGLIAGDDPWTRGLVFGAMPVRLAAARPPKSARPILWLDGQPVAWRGPEPSLYLGFVPLRRVEPALFAMLSRFFDAARDRKLAFAAVNMEPGEALPLPLPPGQPPEVEGGRFVDGQLIASAEPGWLSLSWKGRPLLYGAKHFAELREAAELKTASAQPAPELLLPAARRARLAPLLPSWILTLALLALVLFSFAAREGRGRG